MRHNKKKIQVYILAVGVGLSSLLLPATYDGSVTAKSAYKVAPVSKFKVVNKKTYIYTKPRASTKMDYLPINKNSGVLTTGKTKNGYSQIRYAFNYAYVKTSVLKSVKANNSPNKYAWNTSGNYKFKWYSTSDKFVSKPIFYKNNSYDKNLSTRDFWLYSNGNMTTGNNEFDTSKGLYSGASENGVFDLVVKYPVQKNKTWTVNNSKYKILSTKATVKTSAGTFKNVVKVKSGNYISYYAPNKGLIKTEAKYNNKYSTDFVLIK